MMHVERLTLPAGDAFCLADALDHARIESGPDNFELTMKARAAALELEQYAQLALLTQTIRVTLPEWPDADALALPIAPVMTGATVTVTDDGATFSAFALRPGLRPALALTGDRPMGRVVIEYEAGFGADAASIPSDLRLAIVDQTAAFYDSRGPSDGKTNGMSAHMARIAARYRRVAL